jgi:hypothetical protein
LIKKQQSLLAGLIFPVRDLKFWYQLMQLQHQVLLVSVASAIIPIVNFLLQLFTIYYR